MSTYSGKCDLADLISGLGGWFDKNGQPVKMGQSGVGVYYSDEWLDFLEFKRRTGGVIYQHHKVQVSLWNQDDVARRCPGLEIITRTKTSDDKRCKDGTRTEEYFVYKYWGKEYTLKELNKKGVYVSLEIPFNTLLELLPYYPYIVSVCASNENGMHVVISSEPYPIEQRNESIERGGKLFDSWQHYHKKLQDHYRDVVLKYYNPTGRECIDRVTFNPETCIGALSHPIDPNFKLEWRWVGEKKTHWGDPEIVDAENGIIKMDPANIPLIGNRMLVYYVIAKEPKIELK